METGSFIPAADRLNEEWKAKVAAKVAGIRGNEGESRTDEEIRAQAIVELEAEESKG